MSKREKASRARLRLRESASKHDALVEALVRERGPLLKGSLHLGRTRCGKDNCKCARGEPHATALLVVPEGGARRTQYVRSAERPEVLQRTERYRRFRKTRAELRKLNNDVLAAADELLEALLEPYPSRRQERGSEASDAPPKRRRRQT